MCLPMKPTGCKNNERKNDFCLKYGSEHNKFHVQHCTEEHKFPPKREFVC